MRKTHAFYYHRPLQEPDLSNRTLRDLSIMRNWIYARMGHPVSSGWLREFFEKKPWYQAGSPVAPSQLTSLDRRNAETIVRYELSFPRVKLVARRNALINHDTLLVEQQIELELVEEHLGIWRPTGGDDRPSPLREPKRLDAALTIEDLNDYSRRDLKLLGHLVPARRGKPFVSKLLHEYFSRYAWYVPDSHYTDERFTAVDLENLRLIHRLEMEIGGPLSDDQVAVWLSGP